MQSTNAFISSTDGIRKAKNLFQGLIESTIHDFAKLDVSPLTPIFNIKLDNGYHVIFDTSTKYWCVISFMLNGKLLNNNDGTSDFPMDNLDELADTIACFYDFMGNKTNDDEKDISKIFETAKCDFNEEKECDQEELLIENHKHETFGTLYFQHTNIKV